jgi:two-component system CheB/CheR fusion protein
MSNHPVEPLNGTSQDDETSLVSLKVDDEPKFVVGIGASAGGLESLEHLFRNLPPDSGMAFVVIQHLSPDFKSMMQELLGRDTAMVIHRVEDGMTIRANCVYLLPPKKEMVVVDGKLQLTDQDRNKGLALPIDTFLMSLASEYADKSIGVILSGSGSDGTRGVIEIARCGGFVVCENPQSAKFHSMPSSAIGSGVVDKVAVPEEIGDLLIQFSSEPQVTRRQRIAAVSLQEGLVYGLEAIYQLYRRTHDIDFSVYKDATILRRIHRRLAMSGTGTIDQYAERLLKDESERNTLYADLLIGVTQFFRDPGTFDLMRNDVLPNLVKQRDEGQPFRVWISGCATGEEAYSLAITIHNLFDELDRPQELKLFATDVHKASIDHAGRGIYGADVLEHLPLGYLEKYFTQRGDDYQINADIRKSIVFAPHNLLSDAPFTDLDLVSCRNLLIYFQPTAQSRAISMFHYALRKNGVMLLGGSESPGDLASEFDVMHERERIYRKRRDVSLPNTFRAPMRGTASADLHAAPVRSASTQRAPIGEQHALHNQLLNRFMPPCLLIDQNRHLVDSFGNAERFLRLRARQPSLDVLDLLDDSLRTSLSGAIGRSMQDNKPVRFANVTLEVDGADQAFNLTVGPIADPSISGKHHIITFESLGKRSDVATEAPEEFSGELDASRVHIRQLEDDLRYSRENLQATIEELETSNEELQATNEELIASNEELQSTNEELHSVNEELHTVNAEYQRKNAELAELNQDMDLLLENTDVATVFLDKELHVRRFTSRVRKVFDFVQHDVGRRISSFSPKFSIDDLTTRLWQVLESGQSQECETIAEDGTTYLLRVLPYRSGDTLEGVVLMLVDVSSLEALRKRLQWMSAIVESTDDAIIGQDLDGVITTWNSGAERLYGYTSSEAIGQHVSMMIPEQRRKEVNEYHSAIAAGERLHTRDSIRIRKDGTAIHVSLTVSPVHDANHQLIGISKIARDVSERIAMENKIREQVAQRETFLATLSHELRNPLSAALSASRVLQDERVDEANRRNAAKVVSRQIMMSRSLLSDLLDLSRVTKGKVQLKKTTFDLCSLVDLVRETTLSEAKNHQQEVTWEIPEDPIYIHGDLTRIVQVQVNLIHNALKYSPAHTAVKVSFVINLSRAVISVTDYGVGVESDQLESIFEPFVQVSDKIVQREGGLGVGLTLVRWIVEAHGGTVIAESEGKGTGTTFRVFLPLADRPASHEIATPEEEVDCQGITKRSIVLIEDIHDAREMLTLLLALDGHTVHACCDGESGFEAVLKRKPDVALIDIGLPGIDGYEVARRIRSSKEGQNVFLIALTGFGQAGDVEKATEVGFDMHMVKPVDADLVRDVMESIGNSADA